MSQYELSPEEKSEADNRVADAMVTWLSEVDTRRMSIADVFSAGYRWGYAHAKDDAQQAVEARR